ncbi:MAG: hypothetical protein J4G10_04420 [Alphaproteobacteria bacterium]|nr:hypothetical protein [Alphaproteobacteria bacterium]
MRGLKFLVVFLGVVILGGLVVLGMTIASRTSGPVDGAKPFETVKVALPKGARVAETRTEGDRLVLRLALEGGGERLLILSLKDGRLLGTIELAREP